MIELKAPDRHGNHADVVLGFDSLKRYRIAHPYFGGTIGRYANRIAHGEFELAGKKYELARNDPPHFLHGGNVGFDRRIWEAEPLESETGVSVRFSYVSREGEENFAGTVKAAVTFTLSAEQKLTLQYTAETDRPTPVNLTTHSYFNLAGTGDILEHTLYLNADAYTPVDPSLIPAGNVLPVQNTPFDFRTPQQIGRRTADLGESSGFDHNFVLNGVPNALRLAARLSEPSCGRQLEIWTTDPAIQFYAGGQLSGNDFGKGGVRYQKYAGLCLETQHYPDSPNHPPFLSTILSPEEKFNSVTIFRFSTD